MKVVVTGATGFLGQHLCQRLQQNGFFVTALGRNELIGNQLTALGVHFKKINLEDKKELESICKNQDYVFHCAALSAPWGKKKAFYDANVLGTQHIIHACFNSKHLKKLIYVSSPSIYFDFTPKENIKEDHTLTSTSANFYIESKKEAEKHIDKAHAIGLPVITLRPRALFGPRDNAILPRLMKAIKNNQFPLINDGAAIIDMTYVDNVVDSLLLAMDAPHAHNGKKYNITNGEPIQLRQFLVKLFEEMGLLIQFKRINYAGAMIWATLLECLAKIPRRSLTEPKLTRYSVGVLGLSQTLDISAAKRDLEYLPQVSLNEGIYRTAQWWKKK